VENSTTNSGHLAKKYRSSMGNCSHCKDAEILEVAEKLEQELTEPVLSAGGRPRRTSGRQVYRCRSLGIPLASLSDKKGLVNGEVEWKLRTEKV
jgi:hypothetical protein